MARPAGAAPLMPAAAAASGGGPCVHLTAVTAATSLQARLCSSRQHRLVR